MHSLNEKLKARACLSQQVRDFFIAREVTEVVTPLLGKAPVTDPYLETFKVHDAQLGTRYLQTSPEYAMKCLLSEGSGCIYQLGKAFRAEEAGRLHSPEFTMLEWYRVGMDHMDLMKEVETLLTTTLEIETVHYFTYQQAFVRFLNIDPLTCEDTVLFNTVGQLIGKIEGLDHMDRDTALQLLMSDIVEPQFEQDAITFIYHYPKSQSALAKVAEHDGQKVAERFEVYVGDIELANGYHELTDANEQLKRFEVDLKKRETLGLPEVPIDHDLIAALQQGLPDCAGVALGFDRLLMLKMGTVAI